MMGYYLILGKKSDVCFSGEETYHYVSELLSQPLYDSAWVRFLCESHSEPEEVLITGSEKGDEEFPVTRYHVLSLQNEKFSVNR